MKNLRKQASAPRRNSSRKIPLTQGKYAIVDAADYEWLMQWKWTAYIDRNKPENWRAIRNGNRTGRRGQSIMDAPKGVQVDHRDGNGLNNRRRNLRLATQNQNQWNRGPQRNNKCGIRGVCFDKYNNKWIAVIKHGGEPQRRIGRFKTIEEAAKAYYDEAKRLRGEFFRVEPFKRR